MRMIIQMMLAAMMLTTFATAAFPKTPAKLYRVDGRPVPVSCLEDLADLEGDSRNMPIDLRTCGNAKLRPKSQTDGSVGYDLPDGGYFYYHYVGQSGGIDVISLESSGGGSGHFTELIGVRHSGHFIRLAKRYAGGDRCNGGISDEKVSNGKLTFDRAITPYDFIELARLSQSVEAYKDLEASAASCIGVSHMTGDDAHWTGVSLTESDWPDRDGWTDQFRYQACFNKLYRSTVSGGSGVLDRKRVATFAQAFITRCVQHR